MPFALASVFKWNTPHIVAFLDSLLKFTITLLSTLHLIDEVVHQTKGNLVLHLTIT